MGRNGLLGGQLQHAEATFARVNACLQVYFWLVWFFSALRQRVSPAAAVTNGVFKCAKGLDLWYSTGRHCRQAAEQKVCFITQQQRRLRSVISQYVLWVDPAV